MEMQKLCPVCRTRMTKHDDCLWRVTGEAYYYVYYLHPKTDCSWSLYEFTEEEAEDFESVPYLIPCPFCGGKAEIIETATKGGLPAFDVGCFNPGCDISPVGKKVFDREKAVDAWNQRADSEQEEVPW